TPPGESAPTLLIEGSLVRLQGNPGPYELSRWDGASLTPFEDGFNNQVVGLAPTHWHGAPAMAACGYYWRAAGGGEGGVAVFDGESWTSVGPPTDQASATAIISYDPDDEGPAPEVIVVGGAFDSITNIPARNVAMFDGTRWLPMGAGLPEFPTDFALL